MFKKFPKNIFLQAHSQYIYYLMELAKVLHDKCKSKIYLNCATKEEKEYYKKNWGNIFEDIICINLYRIKIEKYNINKLLILSNELEKKYDEKLIHIIMADRHLGRGFFWGGFYHPKSIMSEKYNYLESLNLIINYIKQLKDYIENNNIDLIINGDKIACMIGREKGIKTVQLIPSRYKSYYYWAENEYTENRLLIDKYGKINNYKNYNVKIDEPQSDYLNVIKEVTKRFKIKNMIKEMIFTFMKHYYWKIKKYDKGKGYLLRDNIYYLYRVRKDYKKLIKYCINDINYIKNIKFIYYPLHIEPERTLLTFSPEYFDQINAILTIAKELPSGVFLGVKEHLTAIGRRPKDYYEQLNSIKNVFLIHPEITGLEIIKLAKGVVTITGTSGFEAAMMGKPVIAFGQHNIYNILNHVKVVRCFDDVPKYIDYILNFNPNVDNLNNDINRFFYALMDISFKLNKKDFEKDKMVDKLIELYNY